MGYVPWQRIYGLATIASAINGSSAYLATVQTIAAERCRSSPTLDIDDRKQTLFSCYFSISTAIMDFLTISDFIQVSVGFLVWNDSFIIFVISPQKCTKKYTLNKVFIDFWYRHFTIRSSTKAHRPHPLKVRWVTSKLLKKSVDQGVCLHYASDFWSNSMISWLISTIDFWGNTSKCTRFRFGPIGHVKGDGLDIWVSPRVNGGRFENG